MKFAVVFALFMDRYVYLGSQECVAAPRGTAAYTLGTPVRVLVTVTLASPAKGSTKPSLKKKTCVKDCTDNDYSPVCGADDSGKKLSFGNECVLNNYNCENNANLKLVSKGECPGSQGIRLS